jgi:DNA-directed RNA polymerase specialized sigma24 family protein
VSTLSSTAPPYQAASNFQQELLALWNDPVIWRLAVRRAGSSDLAEDALQETFYSIARVQCPQRIENLPAFFRTALIHEIDRQRRHLGPRPVENPETVAGYRQPDLLWPHSVPHAVDKEAVRILLAEMWFSRFQREREQLRAMVPGRSSRPSCYRATMIAVAEAILHAAVAGDVSWADCNQDLQAAQPDWFDEPGCPQGTLYQRLSRARKDVQMLLMAVVDREDLSP